MASSPLQERLQSAGARVGEFTGGETALSFGDVEREYRSLREGGSVFDLSCRAKLIVSGADRVRWLNGMVTNNVRDLAANHGMYSFLLNAQGRILGDMFLYNRGEYVLVDTGRDQAARIHETFDKFIIMDEVEIEDASDTLSALGLRGPKCGEILGKAGITAPALQPLEVTDLTWREMGISLVAGEQANEYEIWVAAGNAPRAWDALAEAGAAPTGTEALELARIEAGIPRYGADIRERDLPQETEQYRALNFSKGCYVGQEIVERIRSRGQVHRRLTRFDAAGEVAPGAKIQQGGKDVGEITSVASLPGGPTVALGYVRREAIGGELTAGAARLRAQELSKTA